MSDDYVCAGKRKSKTDKRAKSRFNRYKKGGSMRTSGQIITNESSESEKGGKKGKKRKKRKKK